MKTTNLLKSKSFLLLTLSGIASFNLTACGKAVEFQKTVMSSSGSLESPDPGEPNGEEPLDPGESTNPIDPVIPTPVVMNSKVELFNQSGQGGKVDILFVVDNSPSMKQEQKKLGERLNSFMAGLDKVDWQIAFTTTDVSNGQYGLKGSFQNLAGHGNEKILTKTYADAQTVFLKTVQRSEVASSDEQPLKASILAMQKRDTENAGFFRDGADLAIIVLSDENEMSRGTSKDATKPSQVVAAFNSIFGATKKLSVYGIIIEPGDVACYDVQKGSGNFANAFYGTFVAELSRMTSGLTGSVCDKDYAQTVEDIGNDVRLLSDYFMLQKTPLAGTVQVTMSPVQNITWKVEGKKLSFAKAPQDGTLIQVSYRHAP